jgi:hypothetical protein
MTKASSLDEESNSDNPFLNKRMLRKNDWPEDGSCKWTMFSKIDGEMI